MKAQVNLIRAIGSEFVGRKLRAVVLPVAIMAAIALAAVIWLTTISAWWWLLAAVVISADILLLIGYTVAAFAVKLLRPELTKVQKTGVNDFADKLERVAENIGTPIFIVVFRVARDLIWPRQPSYIQTVAADSTTLHKDLAKLQKLFAD